MNRLDVYDSERNAWRPWFDDGRTLSAKDVTAVDTFVARHFHYHTRIVAVPQKAKSLGVAA